LGSTVQKGSLLSKPVEREIKVGVSYPGPRDVWGDPPSLKNLKYTRMRHFKKKSKIFNPEGPRENVSPGPAVALGGPGTIMVV